MTYADYKAVYVDKAASLASWTKARRSDKMSTANKPQWAKRDRAKVLSPEKYSNLRELAESNGIFLIGVRQFDGEYEVIKQCLEALIDLKSKFPKVSDKRHKLELALSISLDAEDFAETKARTITLNANAYRNVDLLQAEYRKTVDEGWFVRGTDYRAIIHHEFGHVVKNVYQIKPLEIACEITGLPPKATVAWLYDNLSKYAGGYDDGREIISEVFADVSTGDPSEFSRKFYDKLTKLIEVRNSGTGDVNKK